MTEYAKWMQELHDMGEERRKDIDFFSGILLYDRIMDQPFRFDTIMGAFSQHQTQLLWAGYAFEDRGMQKATAQWAMTPGSTVGVLGNVWGVWCYHRADTEDGQEIAVVDIFCKPGVMPFRTARVIYTGVEDYTVQDMSEAEDFPLWRPDR